MTTGAGDVDVRVLGPFGVGVGDRMLELGGPRLRTALALLVADAGRVVSVAALVDGLWGEHAPPGAERTVRTYVSRLRRALLPVAGGRAAEELLVTRPPGYLLRLDPETVDATRFEGLAATGRAALDAGQPAVAARRLAGALRLWRGVAYAEFDDAAALSAERTRLERRRLTAVEDRIEADLATGLGGELIAELEGLTERHPGHERLWGQLMTTLYRSGRQADALGAFRRARQVLVEQFGVDPSPALAEVHRQILAHDPRLLGERRAARPDTGAGPAPAAGPRPAQLPPSVGAFAGRAAEIAALDAVLAGAHPAGADPTGVAIVAVSGTAGVGKTALALHWAHRVAGRFPDGQLYVNLRGFDPSGSVLGAAEAVRGFLDALGVPAERIPAPLDGQTALYRSLLAGKRVLVVLDNARDAEQVRPLLPGSAGCLAVVTSRDTLTGLVARDGARRISLDVLGPDEALGLLRALTGNRADEPDSAAALVRQCARLPLALRIAADLVVTRTGASLADLVADLADERRRLDLLDAGADDSTAVRAVFSWSERHLPVGATRLFWLLGLHPGRDFDAGAAAALAGVDAADARRLVETLGRAHLLSRLGPDRWTMHDLLRAFARERAAERIGEPDRLAAATGLGDFYLSRAVEAMDAAFPETRHRRRATAPAAVSRPAFADGPRARAWLDSERRNLVAVALAASGDLAGRAVEIADTIGPYLTVGYHNAEAFAVHGRALAVAQCAGDGAGRARALLELGAAHARAGRSRDAIDHYDRAAGEFRRLGDLAGEARAVLQLGTSEARLGRYPAALAHYRAALDRHRETGNRPGEGSALASIGQLLWKQGRHQAAVDHLERAATIYGAVGHRVGQGRVLNDLGTVLRRQRRYGEARDRHERALHILQEVGDRAAAACALTDLGRIYSTWGRHSEALDRHERALAVFREIGDLVGEAEVLVDLGDAYQRMGRHADAADRHRQAHAAAVELGDRRMQSIALTGQGRSLCAIGRPAEALALHRAARTHAEDIGDRETQAQALDGMANAQATAGRPEEARRLWARALDVYAELDLPEADELRARLSAAPAESSGIA